MGETLHAKTKPESSSKLWLPPVLASLVALVLGLWILCMMDRTISANCPSQIPMSVLKVVRPVALSTTNEQAQALSPAAQSNTLQTELHSQAPRVWALGVTLATEVAALALVLFSAVRIAREE